MKNLLASIAVLAGLPSHAQSFEITSSTVDAGGGTLTSITYELSATIGQPDASTTLVGSTLELTGGFWGVTPTSLCLADVNGDGLVTPADFNAWILAFNTQSPGCDQNNDGLCTPGDFNAWILNFNTGCD